MDDIIEEIKQSDQIIALTGAGMSVESGIAPFRGENGLWKKFDAEKYASYTSFRKYPERSWELFKLQIEEVYDAEPHEGHFALTKLEEKGLDSVITQNIDGLHKKAGSSGVLEIHGTLLKLLCENCSIKYETDEFIEEIKEGEVPSCANCGSILKPNAILFGEQLPEEVIEKSLQKVKQCDLMFVIGTSAVVQPAACLPFIAKKYGSKIIEINIKQTNITDRITDYFIEGKAGEELGKIIDSLK